MNDTNTDRDLSSVYLWFDTEFTSLNLEEAMLLQVAMVVTNAHLERLLPPDQDFVAYVRLPEGAQCSPWVRNNLADLVKQCESDEAEPLEALDTRLGQYLDNLLSPIPSAPAKRPVLAGNSIHSDWFLARRDLPELTARLNYRVLDVSSWKVFWNQSMRGIPFDKDNMANIERYFPGSFTSSAAQHDAHFDVLASISELSYYRTHLTLDSGVTR